MPHVEQHIGRRAGQAPHDPLAHSALYSAPMRRIEMHLVSLRCHQVLLGASYYSLVVGGEINAEAVW